MIPEPDYVEPVHIWFGPVAADLEPEEIQGDERWRRAIGAACAPLYAEIERLKDCCNEMRFARLERDDYRAALERIAGENFGEGDK